VVLAGPDGYGEPVPAADGARSVSLPVTG
jgi:hypothetical protein